MDLGKQVGPLPLGAWLAVVGGGLGIAVWSQRSGAAASDPGVTPTVDPNSDTGTGVNGQWLDVTPPDTQGLTGAPTTNEEWGAQAINYLIAQGYDPARSQSAITKALQGTKMGVRAYALWTVALAHLGAPPYPVDVAPPVPHVPHSGGGGGGNGTGHHHGGGGGNNPPPSRARWYTVKPGDDLHKIARKFYHDASKANRIFQANQKGHRRPDKSMGWMTSPNMRLTVGRRLYIPPDTNMPNPSGPR